MSDQDQDLFNKTPTDKDPAPAPQDKDLSGTPTNYDPLLGMIVNSDGQQKYTTVEEALKGANHANSHISNLEKELKDLRDAQEKQPKLDDVIAAIQSQNNQDPGNTDDGKPKQLTAADIQGMVEQTMTNISTKATTEQNISTVTGKFKELYGDKASETLYGKANDLGMSQEEINSLISTNPTAVFRMLGIDENIKPDVNTDTGNIDPQNFQQKAPSEIPSSMGYVSSKQLEANWLESKKRTNEKHGFG